jgi:hypothetical protein
LLLNRGHSLTLLPSCFKKTQLSPQQILPAGWEHNSPQGSPIPAFLKSNRSRSVWSNFFNSTVPECKSATTD